MDKTGPCEQQLLNQPELLKVMTHRLTVSRCRDRSSDFCLAEVHLIPPPAEYTTDGTSAEPLWTARCSLSSDVSLCLSMKQTVQMDCDHDAGLFEQIHTGLTPLGWFLCSVLPSCFWIINTDQPVVSVHILSSPTSWWGQYVALLVSWSHACCLIRLWNRF